MIIKTCVDCGAVILSNNVTARRCPVCAERFAERVRKKYKNPPADPLTADVRKADADGCPGHSDSRGSYLLRTERIHRAARMGGRQPVKPPVLWSMQARPGV